MRALDIAKSPQSSLIINFVYALSNCIIGFVSHSWWFITVGAYYTILAITRFLLLVLYNKAKTNDEIAVFARRVTGFLLMGLSLCIIGVNILSAIEERGTVFHEIVMITIALYTFSKIVISIIGIVRAKANSSPIFKTLLNISFADAVVSIYTLQRSMLVSFPGMEANDIRLFNILTGSAVWIILLLLGLNLIGGKMINMAKSKIVKANEKIAEAVTGGYKKIEKGVVEGYKKIEEGVLKGYTKAEDKFVDAYLTKDGESVEEAKERLKNNK